MSRLSLALSITSTFTTNPLFLHRPCINPRRDQVYERCTRFPGSAQFGRVVATVVRTDRLEIELVRLVGRGRPPISPI